MQMTSVQGVSVAHWNPRVPLPFRPRRMFQWTKRLPLSPRVNNFGDLLGPIVVAQQLRLRGVRSESSIMSSVGLAAVGSIVHMVDPGTCIWGAGVNGKHIDQPVAPDLDIRAVRGPLTRRYLMEHGYHVPEVYGDPAVLIDYASWIQEDRTVGRGGVVCIPNLNDSAMRVELQRIPDVRTVSPTEPLAVVLSAIADAELVVGSSLHAVIVAEALGVPSRAVRTSAEPAFKYLDYYEGTGRANVQIALSVTDAIRLGGLDSALVTDPALADSFPKDLWSVGGTPRG